MLQKLKEQDTELDIKGRQRQRLQHIFELQ